MTQHKDQSNHEGREDRFMDVDRMINEGLGGGQVTEDNGLIEDTTTDTMKEPESVIGSAEQTAGMDIERAEEIIQSEKEIPVYFNGHSVWLEEVKLPERTVRLYPLSNPNDRKTVAVEQLFEGSSQ